MIIKKNTNRPKWPVHVCIYCSAAIIKLKVNYLKGYIYW